MWFYHVQNKLEKFSDVVAKIIFILFQFLYIVCVLWPCKDGEAKIQHLGTFFHFNLFQDLYEHFHIGNIGSHALHIHSFNIGKQLSRTWIFS